MSYTNKIRLDQYLVDQGLCNSKSQAQGLILAGKVKVGNVVITKAGSLYTEKALEEKLVTVAEKLPYVSRGGFKLEKALKEFQIDVTGLACLDIGASTGGFTDCLLQKGATKVYAVDVGHGQLDWKLRTDSRVICLEKTNIRNITPALIPESVDICVMDVSFISIKKTLPAILALLDSHHVANAKPTQLITLIKPQFEYKDYCDNKDFDGVVKEKTQHEAILLGVLEDLQKQHPQLSLQQLTFSPITGPKGNMEFLLYGLYPDNNQALENIASLPNGAELERVIHILVESAHLALEKTPEHLV